MVFMEEFEKQGGISFIILYFTGLDEIYYVPFRHLFEYWNRGKNGGRKSFTYAELDKSFQIPLRHGAYVHYLEMLKKDLEDRE